MMDGNARNWFLFEAQLAQKTLWPIWQTIRPRLIFILIEPGFNPLPQELWLLFDIFD